MKKKYILQTLIITTLLLVVGQSRSQAQTFQLRAIKISEAGIPGSFIETTVEVKNLTPFQNEIRIQRVKNNIPDGWATSICLINCYSSLADDIKETLDGDATGYLKLTFETSQTPGEGDVDLVLSSVANPAETYSISLHASTIIPTSADRYGSVKMMTLQQNYPNPFSLSDGATTTISYTTPKAATLTIKFYNLLGKEVRTLVSEYKPAGVYTATWNGRDNSGNVLPSGIYVYKLISGTTTLSRRMLITR